MQAGESIASTPVSISYTGLCAAAFTPGIVNFNSGSRHISQSGVDRVYNNVRNDVHGQLGFFDYSRSDVRG